jgi:hypothetical protein
MKVQCKCGWFGDSDDLINAAGPNLHCPECSADFAPYPSRAFEEPTSGVALGLIYGREPLRTGK